MWFNKSLIDNLAYFDGYTPEQIVNNYPAVCVEQVIDRCRTWADEYPNSRVIYQHRAFRLKALLDEKEPACDS